MSPGSLSGLGGCLDRSWQQKKLMAPGCEPASVRIMMEALRPLVLGQSLAGAGGGGFIYLLTREPRQRGAVMQVLSETQVSYVSQRDTHSQTQRHTHTQRHTCVCVCVCLMCHKETDTHTQA